MSNDGLVYIGVIFGFFIISYFAVRLIIHLRKKNTNTELWATVFEGLTHKTMNLEPLKEPEIHIEKKAKRDGQDKDPLKAKGI